MVEEIKKKMLAWRDYLGYENIYIQEINQAKTKAELEKIMQLYVEHLEQMTNEMVAHAENFKHELFRE